jgi:hypothetical protein
MAAEFMIPGSATAASTAWVLRDGTAGSGIVDSAELNVNAGSGVVVSGLTYGLTNGIGYFDMLPGFSGSIGPTGTSLAVNTRASLYSAPNQLPRVKNAGSGSTLFYTAENAANSNDTCHHFITAGNTTSYITGTCTVRHVYSDGGTVNVAGGVAAESTTYDWFKSSGTWVIAYSSTQLATDAFLCGGTTVFNRGCSGRLVVGSGESVVVDAISETFAYFEVHNGGILILRKATTMTEIVVLPGGEVNGRQALTPVTITTLRHARGARISLADNITITNRVPLGQGAEGV